LKGSCFTHKVLRFAVDLKPHPGSLSFFMGVQG